MIGQDEIPIYESFLDSHDIMHSLFAVSGKTRSNLSIIDKNQMLTTHLRMPGFNFEPQPFLELKEELKTSIPHKEDGNNKDDQS